MVMPADPGDAATRGAIEAMLVEWAWRIDHGDAASAAALFTDDAEVQAAGATSVGIAAIRAALARRAAMTTRVSRHVVSNLRLAPASDTELRGW